MTIDFDAAEILEEIDGIMGMGPDPTKSRPNTFNVSRDVQNARARLEAALAVWRGLPKLNAFALWAGSYLNVFELVDTRARYTLSFVGTAPAPLTPESEQTTHDALVARVDDALASAAPAGVKADLARVYAEINALWSKKPVPFERSPEQEAIDLAGQQGIELTASMAQAERSLEFLAWARANPKSPQRR